MKDCERFEPSIRAYVAGDPVAEDLEALVEHCKTCAECAQLLALHRDLSELGPKVDELEGVDLDALRSDVLSHIRQPGPVRPRRSPWSFFLAPFQLQPAIAAAVLLVVFLAGGLVAGLLRGESNGGVTGRLLAEINDEAVSNHSLTDVEDSPYTYSNVTFRPLEDDRVALGFDVTRHVAVVEPSRSPLVQEVLVHSLLNPSHTGSRLKALSYAPGVLEPKVKQALVFAMRRDENLAVRLKALSILGERTADPEVESAVLATLREDESVQMRLLALDYLAAHSFDPDLLRRTIEERQDTGDEALMVRLAEYRK